MQNGGDALTAEHMYANDEFLLRSEPAGRQGDPDRPLGERD